MGVSIWYSVLITKFIFCQSAWSIESICTCELFCVDHSKFIWDRILVLLHYIMLVILRNWNYMNILIINVIILGSYLIQVGRILCFQQVLRSADLKKKNYYNSIIESKRCTVDFHLFFLSLCCSFRECAVRVV